MNAKLKQQQETFCQQISNTSSYYDISNILIQQVANRRLECEKVEKNISEFIQWKESSAGRKDHLPKIDKFHKEILFKYWEMQLRQAEKATSKATNLTNEIIESVNGQLLNAKLIKESTTEVLPELKLLESQCKERAETHIEVIKKITKRDRENYWNFLINPHHQCLTLQSLTDSTKKSLP